MDELNETAVKNFVKYLQIPTVHPNVDYTECVEFLSEMGESLDLPVTVIYVKPKKPVVIFTWKGQRPELPSVMLNSHMDVVPVAEEHWTHKPFDADIKDGKIYARGAQDMKCIGIEYLEAIRRLKLRGATCLRTVYVTFVPDEEIGGEEGMKLFVETEHFQQMNVGFALDESYANEKEPFHLFYGEKSCWQFTIHCKGPTGHGSLLLKDTAIEKLLIVLNKADEFRKKQLGRVVGDPTKNTDNISSMNCTMIRGGLQRNVIPNEVSASFDCRLAATENVEKFQEMIESWCKEAGPDCRLEFHQHDGLVADTRMDESNPFWAALEKAVIQTGNQLFPLICIGTTDARYVRRKGIPVFGLSPMNNTKALLHANDEHLDIDVFLKAIDCYCEIIPGVANVDV